MTNFSLVVLIFAGDFFYYHWLFFHNMLFLTIYINGTWIQMHNIYNPFTIQIINVCI